MDTSELMEEIKKGFKDQNAKFDEKFDGLRGELGKKFGGLRGELGKKFGGLRGELGKKFDGLRGELGKKFDGLRGEFDEKFGGLRGELDEKFGGLRGEFDEKFGGLRGEFDEKFGGLRGEFDKLRNEFGGLKTSVTEIKDGCDQTHILIENLRRDLKIFDEDTSKDGPIPLARRVTSLEGRVTKLEKWRKAAGPAR